MNEIIIEEATEADIPRIVAIAEALKLRELSTENGFLGAGFSRKDYEAFLREARKPERKVSFTVARPRKGSDCVGFLLGYNEAHVRRPFGKRAEWPHGGTEKSIVDLLSPTIYPLLGFQKGLALKKMLGFKKMFEFKRTTFFIIKQIAVDPEFMHKRIAQTLYLKLFRETHGDYFLAAIITEPKNARSEAFHRRQGFVPIMQCFSVSKLGDGGEREYINRVWLKPARPMVVLQYPPAAPEAERRIFDIRGQDQEKMEQKEPSVLLAADVNNLWKTNFEHAQRLYLHEDNLNWSKMRTLAGVAAALVTGAVYFASSKSQLDRAFFGAFLFCGTVILFFISVTLESGMYFMHSHKQALRILEAQMRLTFSEFVPLLWKVPAKSRTTSIIRAGLYLLLATWISYLLWQAYR